MGVPPAGRAFFTFISVLCFLFAIAGDAPQQLTFGIAWGRIFMIALAFGAAYAVYKVSEE